MSYIDRLFDNTYGGLQKALDLTYRRNEVISGNISNAETPQYRAVSLNFAGELEKAFGANQSELIKTDSRHLDVAANGIAHLEHDNSGATKPDGNNVDLDMQMADLSLNSIKFSDAAALLRKKLGILRMVIRQST